MNQKPFAQATEEVPLFFAVDDAYAPYLGVALRSVVANASSDRRYRAIVLHQSLSDLHVARLSALATDGFVIEFVRMKESFVDLTDRMSNRLRCDYFTLTIFYRLFIADMFPQYDKAIYLDSDIVVPGDVAELFDVPLGSNLFGCVEDTSILGLDALMAYTRDAVGVGEGQHYINSGVLLMDLAALRQERFASRFLTLLNTYHIDCIAPDQDYINGMCRDRITYLDVCWDAMPVVGTPELSHPKIIHYNLFSKPWLYDGIPYEGYFWQYAEGSAYEWDIVDAKARYSDAQRASDARCMELLAERSLRIINDEYTFKKLYDSGREVRL